MRYVGGMHYQAQKMGFAFFIQLIRKKIKKPLGKPLKNTQQFLAISDI